jgi:ribosomal-protein-alanine N-acetyltransferase
MLELKPMTPFDLEEVVQAELRSYPFPWTHGVFVDSLAAGYRAWVGRDPDHGAIVAYGLMMMVLDEAHLLNLCVVPERQRQGFGKHLLDFLFADARANGAKYMFLEVRLSNTVAREMYLHAGFAVIGERRGYYPAHYGREDAIVMSLDLCSARQQQERAA